MKIKSFAKVNLILKIGPKSNDLHDIATLITKINLYDIIDIKLNKTSKIEVITNGATIKQNDNLVYKAIKLLQKVTGFENGVKVVIDKKIPLQAGLGGGSSNAAAVIVYLNTKLKLGLSKNELINIASKVGSDVPSFLSRKPVFVTNKGKKLQEVDIRLPNYLLLVKSKKGIKTKDAYQIYDNNNKKISKVDEANLLKLIRKESILKIMTNDFEVSLFKKYKFLKITSQELAKEGFDKTLLSGSGSAIFGVTNSMAIAKKAYKKLSKKYDFIGIYKFI